MRHNIQISVIVNIVLVAFVAFLFLSSFRKKEAYIVNQQVFESFKGKNELDIKLIKMQEKQQYKLDSLAGLIEKTEDNQSLIQNYDQMAQLFMINKQEVSQRFTADLWKQINGYISDYGDENGYHFIYGATGDGNLMYASDARNITDDLIEYINSKYEGDE